MKHCTPNPRGSVLPRAAVRLAALPFCLALGAACAEARAPGPRTSDSVGLAPQLAGSAGALPAGTIGLLTAGSEPGAVAQSVQQSWLEAVRVERWADAAALIDALPEGDRARPEMRYVRARAAIGAGDGARAISLLSGIEPHLPLLTADVARYRAEAQLLAGPYAEAAAYFSKSTKARDLVRASEAWDKAGDAAGARRAADQAVVAAQRAKSTRDEVHARMHRVRLLQARGAPDAAIDADLRWVATRAPNTPEGKAASDALDKMKRPLSPKERIDAMDGTADVAPDPAATGSRNAKGAGAAAAKPAQKAPVRGDVLHAKAMALFKARDYEAAAKAFRDAAAAHGPREAEALYYAGKSLARAEHDDEALRAYRDVVARFRRTVFADRAAYFTARLLLSSGRFREAAQSYSQYLGAYPRGEHRDDAEYERALSHLSSGNAAAAKKTLAALAKKAKGDDVFKLRELQGVAALRAGDRDGAVQLWTDIARNQPLTWASLTARARLASAGAPLPPLIEPAAARPPAQRLDLRLPPAPALLVSVGLDGDAESHLLAAERQASAGYPGREGEALCGLYGQLTRAKRRYRVGVAAVDAGLLYRAPAESERWAWDCVYPTPFAAGVRALEERHNIPRGLVHALMRQESAFDPAIVSPASAVGLMQLMPSTAKQAATEIPLAAFDAAHLTIPDVNLRLGAFYIAKLLDMFQGNAALAAAAYNAGPRAVSHWLEGGGDDVDLWVARIPYDETRTYVARVAQNLARYQWLAGGDAAVTALSLEMPKGVRAPADAY